MTNVEKNNFNEASTVAAIDGKMLQQVRIHKRLSQQELADQSGVGVATIKRIEKARGLYKCRSTSASRIALALGVEIDDLIEDKFLRVVDIGEDIELHLTRDTTPEEILASSNELIKLVTIRHRILSRKK